jgi:glycerol-3-phosphate acyltransferase PlsX
MKILVDASGGDYAPREVVKGAIKAAAEFNDIEIALVGKKALLHVLVGKHLKKHNITIIDAPQNIGFDEHPVEAVKKKPKSSIVVGISQLKKGNGDAFVSAGNTGAVLCASLFVLGRIESIERPALASLVGLNRSNPAILLDVGANADCRPFNLLQFAQLGEIYAGHLFGINNPRIGLINNGEEETKGNRLAVESHALLKASSLNFIGNVEGKDLATGMADVIVTDGFTGNIILKTVEGLGDSFIKLRQPKSETSGNHRLHGRALLADVGLGFLVKSMDFSEYGGACLLGVKGNIIVSHGRSKAKAIKNAIGLARSTAKGNICQKISEINGEQPGIEQIPEE